MPTTTSLRPALSLRRARTRESPRSIISLVTAVGEGTTQITVSSEGRRPTPRSCDAACSTTPAWRHCGSDVLRGRPRAAVAYLRPQSASGQTYTIQTRVLVLKLTSASVPNANGGVYTATVKAAGHLATLGRDRWQYLLHGYLSYGWLVDIRYDTFASSTGAPCRRWLRSTLRSA